MSPSIWHYKNEVVSHWPSTHPERNSGWGSGMRPSVLLEKLAVQAFREFDALRRFYEPSFFYILTSGKNHYQRHLFLVTSNSLLVTSSSLLPKCVTNCSYPLSLKLHTYQPCPLHLQSNLKGCLSVVGLILPQ